MPRRRFVALLFFLQLRRVDTFRRAAHDHHDLALRIDLRVIVVIELRRRYTVSGKHDRAGDVAARPPAVVEIAVLVVGGCALRRDRQGRALRFHLRRDHVEWLEEAAVFSGALVTVRLQTGRKISRGYLEIRRERVASAKLLRRQEFEMHAQLGRVDLLHCVVGDAIKFLAERGGGENEEEAKSLDFHGRI